MPSKTWRWTSFELSASYWVLLLSLEIIWASNYRNGKGVEETKEADNLTDVQNLLSPLPRC